MKLVFKVATSAGVNFLSDNGNVNLTDGARDHKPESTDNNFIDNFTISYVATENDINQYKFVKEQNAEQKLHIHN